MKNSPPTRFKSFLILFSLLLFTHSLFADSFTPTSGLSPSFLAAPETDTVFRNPAELPLYDNLFGGRMTYGLQDQRFGGSFIFHIPDFALGNVAFSAELFGSNFTQNLVWIDEPESDLGGRFALSNGGGKLLFTWAKKTKLLTIGANVKGLFINDSLGSQRGLGIDLGAFFTPFDDLFLGASANDLGGTQLTTTTGTHTQTIAQVIRLNMAIISGQNMGFSVGIPLNTLIESSNDPNTIWKRFTVEGRKVFGDTFSLSAGYNTKDLYGNLSLKLSDFFSVGLSGSRDIFDDSNSDNIFIPNQFTLTFSYALSFKAVKAINDAATKAGQQMFNPLWDLPALILGGHYRFGHRSSIRRQRHIWEKRQQND